MVTTRAKTHRQMTNRKYTTTHITPHFLYVIITRWHGSASVLRTTTQVNGKVGNSAPAPSETPEPIVTKICMVDYVGDPYPYAKFHHDTITPLRSPNMRKCASSDSASFFWFFRQPIAKTPAPIFTINTSNDAVSRKDVPFGGPENKILNFDPIFPPKPQILRPFSSGLGKFRVKQALTMGMLACKLSLIDIVAQ